MKELRIFKLKYDWYEGEYEETFLAKDVDIETFEKDLIEAKNFAQNLIEKEVEHDYLGKGYSVACLPEYYEQIIWYLTTKLDYSISNIEEDLVYDVNDGVYGKKISLSKIAKKTEISDLD